jgi:predicted PurR-regulated permease PerM
MTKQVVVFSTAVMSTLLAVLVVWQFRSVVGYVLISLALAATVRPFVKYLTTSGFVKRLALIILYLVSLVGLGYLIFLAGKFAMGNIQHLAQTLAGQGSWNLPPWLQGGWFQQALATWLPTPDKLFETVTGEKGQLVLPAVLGFAEGIGGVLRGVFLTLFLSIYWSINQIYFERLWLSLLPSELRKQARDIWRTIEPDLGTYIRSEIVQSILAAVLLGIGYWLLGSPYPSLLALTGALVWLMPVVGAGLAMILPLLIGLLSSVQLSLLTTLYTLIILLALQVWLEPRLFKRRWDNPILTLVILLALADVFGLVGILVAPPLSAICQTLWNLLISNNLAPGAAARVSDLKERQAQLQAAIAEMDGPPPPLVASSMDRLTGLLAKAEPILEAALPAETSELFRPVKPSASLDESPIDKPLNK